MEKKIFLIVVKSFGTFDVPERKIEAALEAASKKIKNEASIKEALEKMTKKKKERRKIKKQISQFFYIIKKLT